uniref:Uncharacterized protein n=1 Tax=Malurus cyaneus samueli TaxID=2593467 RepID=A0A8C5THH9_9PASS
MATVVVVEMDSEASCSIPNPTSLSPSLSHRFLDSKFYLLVHIATSSEVRRQGAGPTQAAPEPPPRPDASLRGQAVAPRSVFSVRDQRFLIYTFHSH